MVPPRIVVHNFGEGPDYSTAEDVGVIPHFAFNFDELPTTRYEQEIVEMPHEYMRSPDITSKYFHIR
jgi:hypothetical protein